jgi:hypothetical protein
MHMPYTLDWDGEHVPEELKELPPGRYVLTEVDQTVPLSAEEESGLREAFAASRAGQGRSLAEIRAALDRILPK